MEKSIEIIIYELKQDLIKAINESGLPPVVSSYVCREVFDGLNAVAANETNRKLQEQAAHAQGGDVSGTVKDENN